jgi:hypothetical protein
MKFTLSVRSRQVPATPSTFAWPPRLPLGADLADDARHLGRERAELLDHPVHGLRGAEELALQRAAVEVERHRLGEVAARHGADHARAPRSSGAEVADERVHRFDGRRPEAAEVADRGAMVIFLPCRRPGRGARSPSPCEVRLHHLVHGVGDLAGDARPLDREGAA